MITVQLVKRVLDGVGAENTDGVFDDAQKVVSESLKFERFQLVPPGADVDNDGNGEGEGEGDDGDFRSH